MVVTTQSSIQNGVSLTSSTSQKVVENISTSKTTPSIAPVVKHINKEKQDIPSKLYEKYEEEDKPGKTLIFVNCLFALELVLCYFFM